MNEFEDEELTGNWASSLGEDGILYRSINANRNTWISNILANIWMESFSQLVEEEWESNISYNYDFFQQYG